MKTDYKALRSENNEIKEIGEHRFGLEPEITVMTARAKCRIYDVRVSCFGKAYRGGQ
jgi:glycine cleavage system regulatory protein